MNTLIEKIQVAMNVSHDDAVTLLVVVPAFIVTIAGIIIIRVVNRPSTLVKNNVDSLKQTGGEKDCKGTGGVSEEDDDTGDKEDGIIDDVIRIIHFEETADHHSYFRFYVRKTDGRIDVLEYNAKSYRIVADVGTGFDTMFVETDTDPYTLIIHVRNVNDIEIA